MLAPNTLLNNRYEIARRLSAGGMGEVYEARDKKSFGRIVALKRIYFERDEIKRLLASNPELREQFIQLFEHEAALLANLQHPGLPRVIEYFADGEDRYLVMDFIGGDDLMGLLRQQSGAFPLHDVLNWADQLLGILEYLHTQPSPVYHRDIKPLNLKLNYEGRVMLLDFGIAKGALGEMTKAATGNTVGSGTPGYAPPEQLLRGYSKFAAQYTDARVDIYAIAATLYHLLTGNVPADANERLVALINQQPDPLMPLNQLNASVPAAVSEIVRKAMALNRDQRHSTVSEMRQALREVVEAEKRAAEQRQRQEEEKHRQEVIRLQQELLHKTAEIERHQREEEKRRQQEADRLRQLEAAWQARQQEDEERQQRERAEERRRLEAERLLEEQKRQAEAERIIQQQPEQESATKFAGSSGAAAAQPAIWQRPIYPPGAPPVSQPRQPNRWPLRKTVIGSSVVLAIILTIYAAVKFGGGNAKPDANSPTAPATNIAPAESPSVKMSTFQFETPILDAKGNVKERRQGEGQYFSEDLGNGIKLDMVAILSGTFLMGSPKNEAERSDDEGPQHQVSIQAFYIGKFEVTQAQWKVVAKLPKVKTDLKNVKPYFTGDDLPMENVSWEEAEEFCARLSAKTGRTYRLPSEAEWEYACRAGTTTPFAFGATITPDIVNYDGIYPYASVTKGTYRQKTVPVGSLGVANGFGLYDMHGNVWEWCEDVYHDNYTNAPTNGSAWLTPRSDGKDHRLLRGGSWYYYSDDCRSAFRFSNAPDYRSSYYGFRVVAVGRT